MKWIVSSLFLAAAAAVTVPLPLLLAAPQTQDDAPVEAAATFQSGPSPGADPQPAVNEEPCSVVIPD